MAQHNDVPIHLRTQSGERRDGVWKITRFDKRDRLIEAWKMIGIFWGLALISVFIPLAHWVLVPLFVILGPIAGLMRYRVTESADRANGICPVCQQDIELDLESRDRLPKWTYCPNCDASIELQAESASG